VECCERRSYQEAHDTDTTNDQHSHHRRHSQLLTAPYFGFDLVREMEQLRGEPERKTCQNARAMGRASGNHHSAIRYVTPDQRHAGADVTILAPRRVLYERARQRTPGRWSGTIRIGHPSPAWCSIPSRRRKDSMRHPKERDNYLDAHRRNEVLPMSPEWTSDARQP
jgi:hypothetical protein